MSLIKEVLSEGFPKKYKGGGGKASKKTLKRLSEETKARFRNAGQCQFCLERHLNKKKCIDPLADGYDSFLMGNPDPSFKPKTNPVLPGNCKFHFGTIGWYLFREGWMIAKNGFPRESFAFARTDSRHVDSCGQRISRMMNGSVDRSRTGDAMIYADDEVYDPIH